MFDFGIGTSELLVIAIVALLVVGPKELPRLLRTIAHFTGKIRGMAREFQGHLNEAMKDTGLDEVKKEVGKMTDFTAQTADFRKEEAEIRKAMESAAPKLEPTAKPETPAEPGPGPLKPQVAGPEAKPAEKPAEAVH